LPVFADPGPVGRTRPALASTATARTWATACAPVSRPRDRHRGL